MTFDDRAHVEPSTVIWATGFAVADGRPRVIAVESGSPDSGEAGIERGV